jgi:hypothetical protein
VLERFPLEQTGLGRAVCLHVTVVVEMIAREIGEHGEIEGDAIHASLVERVRGNFHGNRFCARI